MGPGRRYGDAVGYQGRKACTTTNTLFYQTIRVLYWQCTLRKKDNIMIYFKFRGHYPFPNQNCYQRLVFGLSGFITGLIT
jgi:hypothetical protein